jgi:putative ABC transport system ATP-binding protein
MTAAPAVEAVDLYRFFHAGDDEILALRGVSLRAERGEVVAVTGVSGSGKSTLLACLAGLDEPDGGWVRVGGATMTRRPEAERAALRSRFVGMLFQGGNLVDHLTVEQNLVLAQRLAGRVNRNRVAELLDDVGLADRARSAPPSLSGGEAARAGLALAAINGPSVILADEPTGELDQDTAGRVLRLLRRQADSGTGVVVATHSRDVARLADREVRMLDGRVEG